ncbi:MAG: YggT family protein [Armatimonadetes bacterium]|nr:YggT family protein [Armatimonadota bacterium]
MGLIDLVQILFRALYLLLIIRVVLSWVPGINHYHPAVHLVFRLTSPILDPIRRALPPMGGLDLSPLVAILLLELVQNVLIRVLVQALL